MSKQSVSGRLNEKFIELMEQLADIMLKQGEPFRARAYQKAQETIMAFPSDILSPEQLKGKPGIGGRVYGNWNIKSDRKREGKSCQYFGRCLWNWS